MFQILRLRNSTSSGESRAEINAHASEICARIFNIGDSLWKVCIVTERDDDSFYEAVPLVATNHRVFSSVIARL